MPILCRPFLYSVILCFVVAYPAKAENKAHPPVMTAANADWPPYAYVENGVMKGSAYKITTDVLKKTNLSYEYLFMPWKRVYQLGLSQKNFVIGGVGRTPKRENLFHWIGPVTKGLDIYFYKRTSNQSTLKTLTDLDDYPIGVMRGGYTHDFLLQNGFNGKNIRKASSIPQLWALLEAGRVPYILLPESLEPKNLKSSEYGRAFYAFHVTDYLAVSKATDADLVANLKKAYKQMEKEGNITLE